MSQAEDLLRLGKKYAPRDRRDIDIETLFSEQSLKGALVGGLIALVILNVLWISESLLFDHMFKPFSILQGFFIGRAVRHYGRGIDWKFAAIGAAIAVVASFTGSFLAALFLTDGQLLPRALSHFA